MEKGLLRINTLYHHYSTCIHMFEYRDSVSSLPHCTAKTNHIIKQNHMSIYVYKQHIMHGQRERKLVRINMLNINIHTGTCVYTCTHRHTCIYIVYTCIYTHTETGVHGCVCTPHRLSTISCGQIPLKLNYRNGPCNNS